MRRAASGWRSALLLWVALVVVMGAACGRSRASSTPVQPQAPLPSGPIPAAVAPAPVPTHVPPAPGPPLTPSPSPTAAPTLSPASAAFTVTPTPQPAGPAGISASSTSEPAKAGPLWSGGFDSEDWMDQWGVRRQGRWGIQNMERIDDPTQRFSKVLRVRFPKGSASPEVARSQGAPLGGGGFYADLGLVPRDALHLRYWLRFAEGLDFVKGGKLPGFFGGTVHSGLRIPDGTNGFSTRYMWRRNGDGEVYAYMPTSVREGTSLGRGSWKFQPGQWHALEQQIVLNTPGQRDGRIRVWLDGALVLEEQELLFRTVETLKIEGLFFSTFFGGSDTSWATPRATFIDFADFAVSETYIGP